MGQYCLSWRIAKYGCLLVNTSYIGVQLYLNFEVFTFCNIAPIFAKNIWPFHCQYFHSKTNSFAILVLHCKNLQFKANIFAIFALHCKYFQWKANISVIVAFRWNTFNVKPILNKYWYFIGCVFWRTQYWRYDTT